MASSGEYPNMYSAPLFQNNIRLDSSEVMIASFLELLMTWNLLICSWTRLYMSSFFGFAGSMISSRAMSFFAFFLGMDGIVFSLTVFPSFKYTFSP